MQHVPENSNFVLATGFWHDNFDGVTDEEG
jgi:hypothetical protein